MDTKGDGCKGSEGIYGLGSYCSCTRESAQLGERGKWGTDVLYQTQRPELQ